MDFDIGDWKLDSTDKLSNELFGKPSSAEGQTKKKKKRNKKKILPEQPVKKTLVKKKKEKSVYNNDIESSFNKSEIAGKPAKLQGAGKTPKTKKSSQKTGVKSSLEKSKSKSEAIALSKAKKNQKRKLKQKMVNWQTKAVRELAGAQNGGTKPADTGKKRKRKKKEKTVQTNTRNKYQHLGTTGESGDNTTTQREEHSRQPKAAIKKQHLKDTVLNVSRDKVEVVELNVDKNNKSKKRKANDSGQNESMPAKRAKFDKDKLRQMLDAEQHHHPPKSTEAIVKPAKSDKNTPKTLRERMQETLNAARFRYINEQLYSTHSEKAVALMQEDPHAFQVYHQGFRAQVSKWPTNPLDIVISYINSMPEDAVVADLGCGDATLAASVTQQVHSFDLVAVNDRVTACDIAHVPLGKQSVDVSVFCLSLMGTNLADFILEANRITKKHGILLVAEVISRFHKVSSFIRKMEKFGFQLLNKDVSNKMFIWLEFKKVSKPNKEDLPHIVLEPCIYKKR